MASGIEVESEKRLAWEMNNKRSLRKCTGVAVVVDLSKQTTKEAKQPQRTNEGLLPRKMG